jgi:hypothetical protein
MDPQGPRQPEGVRYTAGLLQFLRADDAPACRGIGGQEGLSLLFGQVVAGGEDG